MFNLCKNVKTGKVYEELQWDAAGRVLLAAHKAKGHVFWVSRENYFNKYEAIFEAKQD